MKKREHFDSIQIVAAIGLFVSAASLFILTNSVYPMVEKEYFFSEQELSSTSSTAEALIQDVLQNYHLVVRYPENAWFGETYLVSMTVTPNEDESMYPAGEEEQALFVEGRLEMDNGKLLPGKTLLTPFRFEQTTKFQWQVQLDSRSLQTGRLWVTFYPAGEETTQNLSAPLMVIPVNVEIHTFFGLKAGVGRLTGTIVGLGCIAIIVWHRHRRAANKE